MLIDVAISGDRNVIKKETGKILKYNAVFVCQGLGFHLILIRQSL
jgi:hypothetical protein